MTNKKIKSVEEDIRIDKYGNTLILIHIKRTFPIFRTKLTKEKVTELYNSGKSCLSKGTKKTKVK